MKDLRTRFDVLAEGAEAAAGDLQSLDDAVRTFSSALGDATAKARKAFMDLGERSVSNDSGPASVQLAGDGGIGQLTASLEGLNGLAVTIGAEMRGALFAAMSPLLGIGDVMTQQLNAVGGTFTTLARRIDAAMKFPAIDKFLEDLTDRAPEGWQKNTVAAIRTANKIYSVWSAMGDVAGKGLGKLARVSFSPVTISAQTLRVSINSITSTARQATASMRSLGSAALASVGIFGGAFAAVAFLRTGIKGASDLNETINKTESILGDAAPAAKAFADGLSSQFGLVKKDVLDAEAAFGGLGKGLGKLSGGALSNFSNKFTQLAADLSSWSNMDLSTATNALQTALAGNQSDELKKLGVVLLDDAVKARAVAEGFATSTKAVSESAKVQARALMLSEQLADANGDLAKTANSPANMYRRLTGTIQNMATTVGQALMPVIVKIGNAFMSGLGQVQSLWERNQDAVTSFQEAAFTAFESVKEGIGTAWTALQSLPEVFQTTFGGQSTDMVKAFGKSIVDNVKAAVDGVGSFLRNMPLYFEIASLKAIKAVTFIEANLNRFGEWFGNNWTKMLTDALNFVIRAFMDLTSMIGNFVVAVAKSAATGFTKFEFDPIPMLRGFKAATEKLPEIVHPAMEAVDKEIAGKWDEIAKRDEAFRKRIKEEVAAANAPAVGNKPNPAIEGKDEKKSEKSKDVKAGALDLGSKEAYSAIVAFKSGQEDQMLKEARKQTELLKKIADQRAAAVNQIKDKPAIINMA